MQTILLQDDPALFRGLEHSLLCRDGIHLLTACRERLLEACESSRADVVMFLPATPQDEAIDLRAGLAALPHAPLCLPVQDGTQARQALRQAGEKLGVAGRGWPRQACRVAVTVRGRGWSSRGWTRDLSPAGAFIGGRCSGTGGDEVRLDLRPARGERVSLAGKLVRVVQASCDLEQLQGMAVAFDNVSQLNADHLQAWATGGTA